MALLLLVAVRVQSCAAVCFCMLVLLERACAFAAAQLELAVVVVGVRSSAAVWFCMLVLVARVQGSAAASSGEGTQCLLGL